MDLYELIQLKTKQLDAGIKMLRTNGTALANSEYAYKIAIAKKVYELKENGVPATLINLTVYGDREVADLRLKRDISEVIYNANTESIASIKLELRLLDSQISREWTNTK